MEGKYTTMGSRSTLHPRVARLQLNQHMESILQPVNDEIVAAFNDEVPITEGRYRPLSQKSFGLIKSRLGRNCHGRQTALGRC